MYKKAFIFIEEILSLYITVICIDNCFNFHFKNIIFNWVRFMVRNVTLVVVQSVALLLLSLGKSMQDNCLEPSAFEEYAFKRYLS